MSELKKLGSLVMRNIKCYFNDKVTFFMSMITPIILLVLFATFLRNVYIDSFKSAFLEGFTVNNRIIEGVAGAWLMSSILSVSSVTVAFCSNTIMVDDKINTCINDFKVSPIKPMTVSLAYFIANFSVTFIVMMCVMVVGHIYIAAVGWYISAGDVFMIILDCICGILFGTLLAGIVENFIATQGGLSALATLVSSMYGFICGAYMPISTFASGLRNILCLLPGTYGVGIMRNHYINGYIQALKEAGVHSEALTAIKDSFDVNLYLFNNKIPLGGMYGILLGACAILLVVFVVIIYLKNKKKA